MSKCFVIGQNLRSSSKYEEATKAFKHGADNDGCVWCIFVYAEILRSNHDKLYAALPYYLEGAIRGHSTCIANLLEEVYNKEEFGLSCTTHGLYNFWIKIMIELDPKLNQDEAHDQRMNSREELRKGCRFCSTENLPEHHLCEGCRCYSYCCKEHQRSDWIANNHRGECRQLKILKHQYRHHAKKIRDAITSGVDPKTIESLQRLRTELGLNRVKEDYDELLQLLDNDDTKDRNKSPNRYDYLTGRPLDGTVHIGSTSNTI